jgi:hypothetical protein
LKITTQSVNALKKHGVLRADVARELALQQIGMTMSLE